MTIALDFVQTAAKPLNAWMTGKVNAVKLQLVGGQSVLIVHGSKSYDYNVETIIPRHRKLFIEADYVVCCHGKMMPPWVQKKIPKELLTENAVEIFAYSATSVAARAL